MADKITKLFLFMNNCGAKKFECEIYAEIGVKKA
jgi:hypothetical protein